MDHDQPFKDLLEAFLPEFVSLFFPEQAARLDWSTVEFIRHELYTDLIEGDRRTLDMVAEVRTLDGSPELLLVHIEVEGDPRRVFPQRMCEYYMVLRLRRRQPVLPIAVYLQPGHGGITTARYEESVLGRPRLWFEYDVVSLPDLRRDQLAETNPVTHALMPLLADRPADPVELVLRSLEGINRTAIDPARQGLLAGFVNHYVPLSPEQLADLDRRLEYTESAEVKRMTTIFHERGRAEGLAEGLVEGLAEGEAREARRLLQRVLEARFGAVPASVAAAITAEVDLARLEELAIRAATCGSLEEFETALAERG